MSILGNWLLSFEKSLPLIIQKKKKPYIILIWRHGPLLERRHIRRFTNTKSAWCLYNYVYTIPAYYLHFSFSIILDIHRGKIVRSIIVY